jgi:hypothetical protein
MITSGAQPPRWQHHLLAIVLPILWASPVALVISMRHITQLLGLFRIIFTVEISIPRYSAYTAQTAGCFANKHLMIYKMER